MEAIAFRQTKRAISASRICVHQIHANIMVNVLWLTMKDLNVLVIVDGEEEIAKVSQNVVVNRQMSQKGLQNY